ncbi:MAG: DUF86 domain-containing protein [Bacteroidales bacterium]|nr:DUF86 domain-containing protein [Bacteroidales bacterium]
MKKKRDVLVYLDDILESAKLIESYVAAISEIEFYQSFEKQDAILHRLQIIGEAAKHVPSTYREKWTQVPWKDIAGIRDIIVHEYFGITLTMIWKTAVEDIPHLKKQILGILENFSAE